MRSTARDRAPSDSIADPDVLANLASFTRHLRAEKDRRDSALFRLFIHTGMRRAEIPPSVLIGARSTAELLGCDDPVHAMWGLSRRRTHVQFATPGDIVCAVIGIRRHLRVNGYHPDRRDKRDWPE